MSDPHSAGGKKRKRAEDEESKHPLSQHEVPAALQDMLRLEIMIPDAKKQLNPRVKRLTKLKKRLVLTFQNDPEGCTGFTNLPGPDGTIWNVELTQKQVQRRWETKDDLIDALVAQFGMKKEAAVAIIDFEHAKVTKDELSVKKGNPKKLANGASLYQQ